VPCGGGGAVSGDGSPIEGGDGPRQTEAEEDVDLSDEMRGDGMG
jgi:hypothetical protein